MVRIPSYSSIFTRSNPQLRSKCQLSTGPTADRQMSLESSLTSDSATRSMTQTPPGLFPSTPECDPSPSTGALAIVSSPEGLRLYG